LEKLGTMLTGTRTSPYGDDLHKKLNLSPCREHIWYRQWRPDGYVLLVWIL